MAYFYAQHIKTASTKAEIAVDYNDYKSLTLTNKHATADVVVDLYLVDQTGTALRQAASYEASTPAKATSVVRTGTKETKIKVPLKNI